MHPPSHHYLYKKKTIPPSLPQSLSLSLTSSPPHIPSCGYYTVDNENCLSCNKLENKVGTSLQPKVIFMGLGWSLHVYTKMCMKCHFIMHQGTLQDKMGHWLSDIWSQSPPPSSSPYLPIKTMPANSYMNMSSSLLMHRHTTYSCN